MSNRLSFNNREDMHTFWENHVSRWQQSSLTQNAYCREHKLKKSPFSYWKKKLNRSQTIDNKKTLSARFIEVTPKALVKPKSLFSIEINNDGSFKLSLNIDSSLFS